MWTLAAAKTSFENKLLHAMKVLDPCANHNEHSARTVLEDLLTLDKNVLTIGVEELGTSDNVSTLAGRKIRKNLTLSGTHIN